MPSLVRASARHACCAVRGALVVLGGKTQGRGCSRVEILSEGAEAFVNLPSLSCGKICDTAALAVEESDSAAGQVLLLGGFTVPPGAPSWSAYLVDLATGMCTPQPDMLHARYGFAAAKIMDGRVVCAGGRLTSLSTSAKVFGPPLQDEADGGSLSASSSLSSSSSGRGEMLRELLARELAVPVGAPDAAWTWRDLPDMSVRRDSCYGCVMSDGRFAVFGGVNHEVGLALTTCEALVFGDNYDNDNGDAYWVPLSPMHDARMASACAAVAGCVIVVGGLPVKSCEVYHEALRRWLRLPCDVPCVYYLYGMGSAMLL
jgi:hypothetical protein